MQQHTTSVVPGSVKRSKVGGVEYEISCCGQRSSSHHIQQAGKFTLDELKRIQADHLSQAAKEHENEVRALEFLGGHAEGCGCESK